MDELFSCLVGTMSFSSCCNRNIFCCSLQGLEWLSFWGFSRFYRSGYETTVEVLK